MKGRLVVGLSVSAAPFDASHDDTAVLEGGTTADILHDQEINFTEFRLTARYGITNAFAVELTVPFRVVDTSIVFRDRASGQPVTLETPNIHHRNETLSGIVDPWLVGNYTWRKDRLRLGAKLGLTVPLGKTEEDPFALGAMGLEHQHLQFGTGTVAPIVGVDAMYAFDRWSLFGYGLTIQNVVENDKGYLASDRYIGGVGAMSKLGTDNWAFRAGSMMQFASAEEWNGIKPDEGNRSRFDVLGSLGVSRELGKHLQANLSVKVPLVTRVGSGQLDYPAIVELSFSGRFELFGGHSHDDHDHMDMDMDMDMDGDGHDHGDHKDMDHEDMDMKGDGHTQNVDIVEIAKAGEAVDLVPVPGVITVFDFWAVWCKPCKELDRRLVDLARKHPGKIAIRKINVVDWDSKATERYLTPGGFNLPHIKVFGTDGKQRFEKSDTPVKLIEEVAKLLAK